MAKSADAFRTISEVADWLDTPAHVLRFWESKFSHVKPVKRAGGRRYYRPSDMLLIGGIKKLLHTDGMTIKGVQKLLREQGVKHVASHSQALDDITAAEASDIALDVEPTQESLPLAQVVEFQRGDKAPAEETPIAEGDAEKPAVAEAPSAAPEVQEPEAEEVDLEAPSDDEPVQAPEVIEDEAKPSPAPEAEPATEEEPSDGTIAEETPALPSFMHRRDAEPKLTEAQEAPVEEPSAPAPKPAKVDVPSDPADDVIADAGLLGQLAALDRPVSRNLADRLGPIIERLRQSRGN